MKDFDLASVDHVLTTTKQVRRRLDLGRSVPVDTMLECIDIASRAPIGGNVQKNRWLIVDDPATKQSLAELYRAQGANYIAAGRQQVREMGSDATAKRVMDSANFLLENLHDVPMMVIPLREDRPGTSTFEQATFWGSVIPGVWSLQLALRARGIGSAWTTFHLYEEQAAHDLLGLPQLVTQIALLPTAFYTGDTFHPAKRLTAAEITYHNRWKHPIDEQQKI